jgi:hypothetical protein
VNIGLKKDPIIKKFFLTHVIKGKISFTPMETILTIIRELENLEGLVKLTKKQKNEEHKVLSTNAATQQLPTLCWININKNHISKTLHLLVEMNDCIVEGLVDIGASMLLYVSSCNSKGASDYTLSCWI